MTRLKLALEEGFQDDYVVVLADGRMIAEETDVTTRYQISLARLVEIDLPPGTTEIEIRLPEKGLAGAIETDGSVPGTLRVSLGRDGRELAFVRDEPLRFA
ncbi:hypothetical protein [Sphingosinicella terrae]|uniref:hypothetical protein n=1 Tax=Sphingosinicella terrae TaxID=2172047 RepID=UPI000E0D9AC1|nr:hypothetical protein [Sphingosinicella terrae]